MLEEFAARQGFTNIVHFTDDGISGTCFDRPGFLAMMKEVEAGNVEYLCIKDMSRMGRDYLKVGQIMEILRQRGVRLIAINDGVDSARGDDDFTPFRNIMNEYYARDTSRKIRSTFQSKGKSGKHLTGTVIYGYLWNEARDQWLVDPEAADVVKRIFAMTIDGYGPYQIASKLKSEKVNITYTQNGDYLIPNIVIRKTKPLGHYGRLRKAYLEMHRPILFNELVLSDKLFEHCAEIDEAARNRMELIVRSLAEQNGVTEQLKAKNQMEWVRQMNACKAQAEEIVKAELIYD